MTNKVKEKKKIREKTQRFILVRSKTSRPTFGLQGKAT